MGKYGYGGKGMQIVRRKREMEWKELEVTELSR